MSLISAKLADSVLAGLVLSAVHIGERSLVLQSHGLVLSASISGGFFLSALPRIEVAATLTSLLEQAQRDNVANQMGEALQVLKAAAAECRNILGAAASPEDYFPSQEGRSFGIEGNPSVQEVPIPLYAMMV